MKARPRVQNMKHVQQMMTCHYIKVIVYEGYSIHVCSSHAHGNALMLQTHVPRKKATDQIRKHASPRARATLTISLLVVAPHSNPSHFDFV
jgi:hypothetical protein